MKHTRSLVLVGVIFVSLIVISLLTAFLTSRIVQKRQVEPSTTVPVTLSPTQKEATIYLDLPSSFPRDFPLPGSAKVTVGRESADDWVGVFLTVESVEGVRDFYLTELPKTGWQITNQSQGGGLSIIYTNKDTREAIVAIGKGEGGITVSVTILKGS